MTDLQNAVILITGAGGGFGREMTKQFSSAGSKLILSDYDVSNIEPQINILTCYQADLSSRDGCESLFEQVKADNFSPDILINNAGIARYGRFDELPDEEWESVININLLAPMRLCHLFMPEMIARKSGHIINISSMAGWAGIKGDAAYSTAKYGLRGFGESIYAELKPHNVHVTTVYPFFSRTPILEIKSFGSLKPPGLPDNLITNPEDVIAEVINGIRKNKQHVFPDNYAKMIVWMKRFAPWTLNLLNRRIERQTRQ